MIVKWFGHLGTLASLIGIITLLKIDSPKSVFFIYTLIFVAVGLFILAIYSEIKNYKKPGLHCKDEIEINKYMINWIKKGGRVIVFTRDMSWAQSDINVKRMLINKAEDNELEIVLLEKNSFTNELQEKGASIYTYGDLGYTPKSRFTIVRTDRVDSKVAIGSEKDGNHYIEEFGSSDGYPLHIANDLIHIIKQFNKLQEND
ncbi:hypothetical protein COJ07_21480 [Bacillus cereus]|uniref:Uncharacterized protein n=1 Tax=Bacillus cereus TaxID=1396 RepID=A0A2B3TYH2_BACCE|nr:hypothetical protein [Bacillus cereus]PFL17644.1 hypothetical protein COJ07_21480 [Bacillus cereus]PFU39444.1 hypothetical protein COK86_22450 [Bacillus cereus]